jgi:cytidylate kinase
MKGRSVEQIIEEQAHRWQLQRAEKRKREEPRCPVITVSRQHGAGGAGVARRVAEELAFDFFDRELIKRIAEDAHLSERVVAALDDKDRAWLTDWLLAFSNDRNLSQLGYIYHLIRVVGAIARHGGAVILGRGAHLILGQGEALRVLVVAPLDARVAAVMRRERLGPREARQRIAEVEAERKAFLMKCFHGDFGDLSSFDLVVNTGTLGEEGAAGTVRAALAKLPLKEPAALVHC